MNYYRWKLLLGSHCDLSQCGGSTKWISFFFRFDSISNQRGSNFGKLQVRKSSLSPVGHLEVNWLEQGMT